MTGTSELVHQTDVIITVLLVALVGRTAIHHAVTELGRRQASGWEKSLV